MPVHQSYLSRLERLLDRIPFHSPDDYPDSALLLSRMAEDYTGGDAARRRKIERDLDELLQTGQIEVVNPGGKPRNFRRLANDPASDPHLLDYIKTLSNALLNERLPNRRDAQLWQQLRDRQQRPLLSERRFRAISDSQRLLPADIKSEVLINVLAGLIQRRALQVGYRKPDNSLQKPLLHPQGLLQRGPILYLYALKNDEDQTKMFALHRMTSATLSDSTARDDPDFDLDQRIREGDADYGGGEPIQLQLRVGGYVLRLLRDCPLSDDQQITGEQEDEDDELVATISATVPATGQLYRWLLGFGAHVEVLSPACLRTEIARTAEDVTRIYR